jgi:cytochrome c551/c552
MSSSAERTGRRRIEVLRRPLDRVRAVALGGLLATLGAVGAAAPADSFPGIGRPAMPKELAAWDIDVRPDFKGLPAGSGTVQQGMAVWEGKCASCHGVFGESNEVFNPLVGGTTADDVRTGRAARLLDRGYPGRTTLMKVPTVSTLWDYIRRAMPWNAPKSLSVDEVYAVTAYLLNLGGVLPDDFTLSQATMSQAQDRLPNRNGMTTDHGLWPGKGMGDGKPDVRATACMKDCPAAPEVKSQLPAFARNAHGNLAEQNRLVGAQHGADTRPPDAAGAAASAPTEVAVADPHAAPMGLLKQNLCMACHGMDQKLVGPSFADVARKYADRADRQTALAASIRSGGSGRWGPAAMPPQTLPDADLQRIARWLADGARP